MKLPSLLLTMFVFSLGVQGIVFDLPTGKFKCVMEEVRQLVTVTGKFDTVSGQAPNRELVLRILDTKGGEVLKQSETSGVGTFSFVPQESGDYQFCLQDSSRGGTRGQQQRVVSLDIQALPKEDSIDFSELAKRENLKPLEVKLKKIEAEVSGVQHEVQFQKTREAELREINESTNARTAWLSIFALLVLVGSSCWQIVYLKRYFSKKKLI